MSIYDLAIIGAGPAGSTLAKNVSKIGIHIAIIDARPLDKYFQNGNFKKPCGGLLSRNAQKFLAKNNIALPNEILASPQPFNVLTTDFNISISRNYYRKYVNMNREKFDRWLLKDLNNVDKIFNIRVLNIAYDNNIFTIFLSSGHKIKAKILVGADGANSIVRSTFFADLKIKKYIALQEIFEKCDNSANYSCYFDKTISDYYGWSMVKDNNFIIGYAINMDNKVNGKFNIFKTKLKKLGVDISKPVSKEGTLLFRPNFFHKISVGCDSKAYLIGETGGYISPSSAEGISYAFKTAEILSNSIIKNIKNENYKKIERSFRLKMIKIQILIFIKNCKSLFINTPFLRHVIMKLGIQNLNK